MPVITPLRDILRGAHQCHRPDNWKLITPLMLRQLGIVSWIIGVVIETIVSAMAVAGLWDEERARHISRDYLVERLAMNQD